MPSRCPICHAARRIEPSPGTYDAPCPSCGALLWFLPTEEGLIAYDAEIAAPVFDKVMRIFADHLAIARDELDANTFIREIGADSLDIVELVMELEEEFGVTASDSVAENIRTIADAIRYIIERLRERG